MLSQLVFIIEGGVWGDFYIYIYMRSSACNTVRNKNVSTCLSNTLKQVDKCFLKILWLQETEIHL